jgi:hypothetical protein
VAPRPDADTDYEGIIEALRTLVRHLES